ncbi:MAG: hypothetical protein COB08_019335 [Rhodobacteraceae bacterium]|nr:hypothetical protein [Paracoccaceae bacterium]
MSKKMGELTVKHEGKKYRLCLTNRAVGTLQDEYGRDMADLMPPDGGVPHFGAIVRAVELSLQRHHPDEATVEFADDLLGSDRGVFGDLLGVTFPEMKAESSGKKPKAARRKKTT